MSGVHIIALASCLFEGFWWKSLPEERNTTNCVHVRTIIRDVIYIMELKNPWPTCIFFRRREQRTIFRRLSRRLCRRVRGGRGDSKTNNGSADPARRNYRPGSNSFPIFRALSIRVVCVCINAEYYLPIILSLVMKFRDSSPDEPQ